MGRKFGRNRHGRSGPLEIVDGIVQPLRCSRVRGPRVETFFRPDRRHDQDFIAHIVEDRGDRRAHQDRVGQIQRIGRWSGQSLDQAHHVVAEIAEQRDRHRGQPGRKRHARLVYQRAERLQRLAAMIVRPEIRRCGTGVAVDFGFAVTTAPDQIGLKADDRITPARFTALDALEQERVVPAFAQLQERRHRRFEIGDQACVKRLRLAAVIGVREGGEVRQDGHRPLTSRYRRRRQAHDRP